MKKSTVDLVRKYVRRLPDEDLVYLHARLSQRLGGDLGEAVTFIEKSPEMDRWFATASSADDLYDMCDLVYQYLESDPRCKPRPKR